MNAVRILAPAKLNLGLAVLGKRDDGYHNIDTIMAMIDFADEITVTPGVVSGISISGMDDVPIDSNLMTKAIQLWCDEAYVAPNWHIDIVKNLPSPGGIGGGSSDAAAVLRALNALYDEPLPGEVLQQIAAEIGADCPFFLGAATARANGTGSELEPLPTPQGHVVLAIPEIRVGAKTGALYGALQTEDFGSTADIDPLVHAISHNAPLPNRLKNSFSRPAMELMPELTTVERTLLEVAESANLSGAGPAMYAIAETRSIAETWAEHLQAELTEDIRIVVADFLATPPAPELLP